MNVFAQILGPKSKYDSSLPYTYEARIPIFAGEEQYNSYFSDTICGLVEYLHQHAIAPAEVKIIEIYQNRETALDPQLFTSAEQQWLFKPHICRSFAAHYEGHIQESSCSFNDRNCQGSGPYA